MRTNTYVQVKHVLETVRQMSGQILQNCAVLVKITVVGEKQKLYTTFDIVLNNYPFEAHMK